MPFSRNICVGKRHGYKFESKGHFHIIESKKGFYCQELLIVYAACGYMRAKHARGIKNEINKEGLCMLKVLDEKILRTDSDIEKLYKNCKYLCTIDGYDKLADNNGYLYCISTSEDSYDQLYDIRSKLIKEGKCCVIGGSYNNGGAVGVQYECKCE